MEIRELHSADEWAQGFEVLKELRTTLTLVEYMELVKKMVEGGYRAFVLKVDNEMISYAGVSEATNFYNGHYLFVFDFVTKSSHRSKGYGEQLLSFLEDEAKKLGCTKICLDSGLQRLEAHRFYEDKMKFNKSSYAFKKEL
ncbi:GNAT family N-acetyltransferase [Rossellomorea aquimaris]|uniref:GNAT family N-acetyltransferase n=1 Tax=Rossellomorea aquimaris TaxID=189382 RepID=UPI0007D052EC|nr:GNAT family N-acetyltransferase [Rossellomorea aquimaris]